MKEHKTGFIVWLFGDQFWHSTFDGAWRRSKQAWNWCNGEHNRIIEVNSGRRVEGKDDETGELIYR